MKIKQISPQNSNFLKRLEYIALKPKTLYYYGKLPDFCEDGTDVGFEEGRPPVVAIVGSRKMTPYGREQAYRAAYELAEEGFVVVSGLATGVDSAAHRGALDAGGRTVGVLGTPIDRVYPACNRGLAAEIIQRGGAILSECPPFGTHTSGSSGARGGGFEVDFGVEQSEMERWRAVMGSRNGARAVFLRRNRLISGVADAVIVVEADLKSGSLNTAAHAMEQGRLLFAVPGDVTRQMSRGCNALFGKGAAAYTSADDVLDELFLKRRKKKRPEVRGDTPEEEAVIAAMRAGLTAGEEILAFVVEKTEVEMDAALFSQTVTMMEITGKVRRLQMNNWALM